MSQPVKVSDALGLNARLVLRGDQMLALCKAGRALRLSASLKTVDSVEGHKRLVRHLKSLSYPHYEPAPNAPGLLVRIEANGKRRTGRFVNRKFQEAASRRK